MKLTTTTNVSLDGVMDLRDPRRLRGVWRFEQQPHRSGVEHAARVRGIGHAHRPAMGGTTVLSGVVAAAIGELNATPGRELQVHGGGSSTPRLTIRIGTA
jgi:hypothetical protein